MICSFFPHQAGNRIKLNKIKTGSSAEAESEFEFPAITIFESCGGCTSGFPVVVVSGIFGFVGEHFRGPLMVRSRWTLAEKSLKSLSVALHEVRPQSRHFPAVS